MKITLLLLGVLMLASTLFGSEAATQTTVSLKTYSLEVNGTQMAGDGAAVLKDEISKAQFILYGEDHGFADSPIVLRGIAQTARPLGFTHLVIEVGPLSTAVLSEKLSHGGVPAIAEIVHQAPMSIPFLSLKDDAELASDFLGKDAKGQPYLWGVDQEFIGSPALHLERLVAIAPDAAARSATQTLLDKERDAAAQGAMDHFLMSSGKPADFDALAAAFKGQSEAQTIIAEMRESAAIYQLWMSNHNYENNARRARLLASNFLARYHAAADTKPKVIFKMGVEHTRLGTSTVNTIDLGTLATEIAVTNNMRALRICFLPIGGQNTTFAPKPGNPTTIQTYDDAETKHFFSAIGLGAASLSKSGWTLVPLEPIRQSLDTKGIEALEPMSRFLLLGFDYVITTADAKPAKFLY